MLHPDFKNGEKLNLHSALALFIIVMGFLFMIDAAPGSHTVVAGSLILFGFAWYLANHAYIWWRQHHPHSQWHPHNPQPPVHRRH